MARIIFLGAVVASFDLGANGIWWWIVILPAVLLDVELVADPEARFSPLRDRRSPWLVLLHLIMCQKREYPSDRAYFYHISGFIFARPSPMIVL